jgi:hypothetical protein
MQTKLWYMITSLIFWENFRTWTVLTPLIKKDFSLFLDIHLLIYPARFHTIILIIL